MTYTQVCTAQDWFFVHKTGREADPPIVWHIAAWALTDAGEVVGLVGAFGEEQGREGVSPKLTIVPPVPGAYLHRDQLSEIELQKARKR